MQFLLAHKKIVLGALLAVCAVVVLIVVVLPKPKVVEQPASEVVSVSTKVIGTSVEGRSIEEYSFGTGTSTIILVGGMHGGYEWNSVVLAYKMIDYLTEDPLRVPSDMTIKIIPNLNPDGVTKVANKEGKITETDVLIKSDTTGIGRFNANGVDLNRNFNCKWQATSTWKGAPVKAGTQPFSEPEATALWDSVQGLEGARELRAVVFWHSQANAVYASECENGVLPITTDIMNAYAGASGYTPVSSFDAYPVTGDAEGWLASIGIPAITVELKTHTSVEWEENRKGVEALLNYFSVMR